MRHTETCDATVNLSGSTYAYGESSLDVEGFIVISFYEDELSVVEMTANIYSAYLGWHNTTVYCLPG